MEQQPLMHDENGPEKAQNEAHEAAHATAPMADVRRARVSHASMLRIMLGVTLLLLCVSLVRTTADVLARICMGIVFALAVDPIVRRLQARLRCARGTAIALVAVVVITVFGALVAIVGPSALSQAQRTTSTLPLTIDQLSRMPILGDILRSAHASERVREWLRTLPAEISNGAIVRFFQSVVDGLAAGVTIIVVGVAALLDGSFLLRQVSALVPDSLRTSATSAGRVFYRTISAYFAGSLMVSALAATFVLVVGLALGVPLAPVAAVWVLVVNLIPQVGGLLCALMFTTLALGRSPGTAVACLVLYWAYMTFENHVITPAIVGNAVNLSMAATMLAVLIGGTVAGVPGAILSAPLAGTVKGLYLEFSPYAADAAALHESTQHEGMSSRRRGWRTLVQRFNGKRPKHSAK